MPQRAEYTIRVNSTMPEAGALKWRAKRSAGFVLTRAIPIPFPLVVSGHGATTKIAATMKDLGVLLTHARDHSGSSPF